MNIQNIKIEDIIPYNHNPRDNDKSVPYVKESIQNFGFKVPIILDKNNIIVCGHTRYKAAKELNMTEVPCIMADDLNEEQIKAFRLADNKVGEFSTWDFEELSKELEGISELDMEEFGFFEDEETEKKEIEVVEDDFTADVTEEPKAKPGDIYQLGRHRLMCGDSTSPTDIEKLIGGVQIDLVFTDPPYGMKKEADGVANDNLNYDDLLEFNRQWIPLTFQVLKENGSWYCWGIDEPLMDIYSNILKPMAKENKITFRNLITWDKGSGQGQLSEGFRMYAPADEKCLFVMCGVQGFNTNSDYYDETFEPIRAYMENEAKKVNLNGKKLQEITGTQMYARWFTKSQFLIITEKHYKTLQEYYDGQAFEKPYNELRKLFNKEAVMQKRTYFNNTHDNMNNVWHFDRAGKNERVGHATPKPIALCARAIKSSSRENENVLDAFGGSGSTLIACEELNRTAYLMELEPKWVDAIINRWEKFTGQKAQLIN